MPSHALTLALIEACGFPLAAPSANLSGRPSPTLAAHVYHDLFGKIPMIIDQNCTLDLHEDQLESTCQRGIESTVLKVDSLGKATLLRPGPISLEILQQVLGHENISLYIPEKKLEINPADVSHIRSCSIEGTPLSPGMKYTHYSPSVPFILVQRPETDPQFGSYLDKIVSLFHSETKLYPAFLLYKNDHLGLMDNRFHFLLGDNHASSTLNLGSIARDLFKGLRHLDSLKPPCIIMASLPDSKGESLGIMNRVEKAAKVHFPESPSSDDWENLRQFFQSLKILN